MPVFVHKVILNSCSDTLSEVVVFHDISDIAVLL